MQRELAEPRRVSMHFPQFQHRFSDSALGYSQHLGNSRKSRQSRESAVSSLQSRESAAAAAAAVGIWQRPLRVVTTSLTS